MNRLIALLLAALTSGAASSPHVRSSRPRDARLVGRWDVTITMPNGTAPSWIEIDTSGRDALVGHIVGVVGNVRPISEVIAEGDSIRFAVPHQWEAGDGDLRVVARLQGDRLVGNMTFPDDATYPFQAVRAPLLLRTRAPAWGAPIRLLDRNDLNGWQPMGSPNQWVVRNGILSSPRSGVNIRTVRTFNDFKLHVEFRYPSGSNSGVYLRGRHEVQIEDDYGREPYSHRFSGIYGFVTPSEIAARPAGQWQTYDITLVGRLVTVVANGKRVICNQEIPGITGGAIDSNEGEPGPIYLQGDHGPIEYRNIVITPAR